jgi:hypothetical protein
MNEYMRKHPGKEAPYDPQPAPFNYGSFEPYEPKGKTLNEQIFYMDQAKFIESLHNQIVGQQKPKKD